MDRRDIASLVIERLAAERGPASRQFDTDHYFVVDDLLPVNLATHIYQGFPATQQMTLRKSIRELKYVTSQMNRCAPLLEEAIFALQDERVVRSIGGITGLEALEPDARLYAGGVSLMSHGHYLHPHIDNSHDMERARYRVLNLLYYTSPDWQEDFGGNLELWPDGPRGLPHTIHSKFNRLLVIATNRTSWHSVSRISAHGKRTCVSNYYFSPKSPEGTDYFHVTSFRGRPGQPVLNMALRADAALRGLVRKVFAKGAVRTKHFYK